MDLILIVLAIVCFILAGFGVSIGRVQLGWIGLALYMFTVAT